VADTVPVRPGQVWADNDPRSTGRYLRVEFVTGESADRPNCARVVQCTADGTVIGYRSIWIALRRMRPTSNGYRLVKDVDGGTS
jgi:hypothetical protein